MISWYKTAIIIIIEEHTNIIIIHHTKLLTKASIIMKITNEGMLDYLD